MAYTITDECVACGVCMDECAADAIKEGDEIYVIDKELCTGCGSCVDACPSEAFIDK